MKKLTDINLNQEFSSDIIEKFDFYKKAIIVLEIEFLNFPASKPLPKTEIN